MSTIKTLENDASITDFIESVDNPIRKEDAYKLLEIFKRITGEEAKMWGSSIIGFGNYHYKSEKSKQEGDWMLTAFSPRKQNLTLYILPGFENYGDLLERLGKHKTSVGCLYLNKLADVDMNVLEELIEKAFKDMKKIHGVK